MGGFNPAWWITFGIGMLLVAADIRLRGRIKKIFGKGLLSNWNPRRKYRRRRSRHELA